MFLERTTVRAHLGHLALAALVAGISACSSVTPNSSSGVDASTSVAEDTVALEGQEVASPSTSTDNAAPTATEKKWTRGHHRKGHRQKVAALATAPFEVDGFWMNAYYFPRAEGENWESLSRTLYGRPDRAEFLEKWNAGRPIVVGQPLYYNSPARPDDATALKSFAEDFGYPLEGVTVQAGDTLGTISQRHFGQTMSWLEIASMNPELTNPDAIEIGQTLRIQTAQVDTTAVLNQIIAQASAAATKTPTEPDPIERPAASQTAQTTPPPQVAPKQPTQEPKLTTPPARVSRSAGPLSRFTMNDYMLMVGGLALVTLIIIRWLAMRKAKKQAPDPFHDDRKSA